MTELGITFRVLGIPRPQGSKRAFLHPHTKKPIVTEQTGEGLRSWRQDMAVKASEASTRGTFDEAVGMHLRFFLPRPASVRKRGWPAVAPDIDKLVRAALDAMVVGGLISDDKLVCSLCVTKHYADAEAPGLEARVWALEELPAVAEGGRS